MSTQVISFMDLIGDGSENYPKPIYDPKDNVMVIGEHCLIPGFIKTCPLMLVIARIQK